MSQQNVGADGRARGRVRARGRAGARAGARAHARVCVRAGVRAWAGARARLSKSKAQTTKEQRTKSRDGFGTVLGRFRDGFEVGKYRDGSRDAFGTKAEFSPEENQRSERYLREHLGIRSPAVLAYPRVALPPCPRTLEYLCRSKPPYGSANFGGSPRRYSISKLPRSRRMRDSARVR